MSLDDKKACPSDSRGAFAIELSASAIDVLHGLFIEGPLWDGDVPSKSGRDELVTFGLVLRHNGWQQLTKKGLEMAVACGLDRKKEKNYRKRRTALNLLDAVETAMNPPENMRGLETQPLSDVT